MSSNKGAGRAACSCKIQFVKSFTMCPCFYLCVFQFDALSWKKEVSCKIPIFTSISFSILLKSHETLYLYCLLKVSVCVFFMLLIKRPRP